MQGCFNSMNLKNLKIQGFFTTLIITTVSVLTISDATSQKVIAQNSPSCDNATISGSYGIKFTGTFPGQAALAVGLLNFDGAGNFQGIDTVNLNGTTRNRTLFGNYSVSRNCTVQINYTGTEYGNTNGVIVDGNKEIWFIQNDANTAVIGTLKKIN